MAVEQSFLTTVWPEFDVPATPAIKAAYGSRLGSPPTPATLDYTKRPIGDPPVTELSPRTPSQQIRLQHRAGSLIQRYAGNRWREAQKTKWLLDVVLHIDTDYRDYIQQQAAEIENLHEQLFRLQETHGTSVSTAQTKESGLQSQVHALEAQVRAANEDNLQLKARLSACEDALAETQRAAEVAAEECTLLQGAIGTMHASDAAARKRLATRAHLLKEALLRDRTQLRQHVQNERRQGVQVAAMLKLKDDAMATERHAMQQQLAAQVTAIHNVERAAAQLQVERVELELQAYKEPWTYLYGKKSPTRNAQLAEHLGLKSSSLNVAVPY